MWKKLEHGTTGCFPVLDAVGRPSGPSKQKPPHKGSLSLPLRLTALRFLIQTADVDRLRPRVVSAQLYFSVGRGFQGSDTTTCLPFHSSLSDEMAAPLSIPSTFTWPSACLAALRMRPLLDFPRASSDLVNPYMPHLDLQHTLFTTQTSCWSRPIFRSSKQAITRTSPVCAPLLLLLRLIKGRQHPPPARLSTCLPTTHSKSTRTFSILPSRLV